MLEIEVDPQLKTASDKILSSAYNLAQPMIRIHAELQQQILRGNKSHDGKPLVVVVLNMRVLASAMHILQIQLMQGDDYLKRLLAAQVY